MVKIDLQAIILLTTLAATSWGIGYMFKDFVKTFKAVKKGESS